MIGSCLMDAEPGARHLQSRLRQWAPRGGRRRGGLSITRMVQHR